MRRVTGFTLVELMVVVAILGILAAIAYPSFDRYLQRSRRSDAQQFIMAMEARQKQILIEQRAYATAPNALNVSASGWSCTATQCENQYYTITFDPAVDNSATPPEYGICAAPKAATSQVPDGSLMYHSTGTKRRFTSGSCAAPGSDLGW